MFFNYFYGFFTGLSLGEMTIFEVQFTTIFGPFDHGLGATITRNRNGMEVSLESLHIIQVITRRFSFKEKKKRVLQTLFDIDYSENNNKKSNKTNEVWLEKGAMHHRQRQEISEENSLNIKHEKFPLISALAFKK